MRRPPVLLAALLLGGGVLTACTSEEPTSLSAPEVYYLPPDGKKTAVENKPEFQVRVDGDEPYPRTGTRRVTVDVVGGSVDVVWLRWSGPDCKGGAAHVTCDISGIFINGGGSQRVVPVAAKGAKAGDSAVVRFTYATKDGKKLTARTKVVVGEPVVEVAAPKVFKDVRPGAEVTEPLVVRNTGTVPVRGLGIELGVGAAEFVERYDNCRYPDPKLYHGNIAVCRIPDVRIAPGESVALKGGVRVRASKTVMHGAVVSQVWPLDTKPESKNGDLGDGPSLEAEARPAARGTFAAGGSETRLTLDTRADYEVTGIDLHGDPGDVRKLRLTVRNNGPGDPGDVAELVFNQPYDSGVLKQPMTEIDDGEYGPYCENGILTYVCPIEDLAPGQTRTFEFTLRLGEPGTGSVSVQDTEAATKAGTVRRDPRPANDEAVITIGK
ncbi:hypothetical protein ACFY1L_23865 [Streptomyces sp. NPDC001663]|uniref:hypothetical protein n=1 Tax=Streptomyces sp. NPDC001663 TaxID=3364597 RepID=UPI003696BF8F